MKKSKNVGAGPVSAQKEVIDNCPDFLKRSKQKNIECSSVHSNFNGITLIALIITVIVMLILVGVTISVSLNGGLFETATKAATGTQKEKERERLTEVALASYNVSESKISDVDSLVGKLSGMGFSKDESKSSVSNAKLVVQGKSTLWQIDLISAKVEPYAEGSTYTFTIGELGDRGLLEQSFYNEDGGFIWTKEEFFPENISEELKNSTLKINLDDNEILTYNVKSSYKNILTEGDGSGEPNSYYIVLNGDDVAFLAMNEKEELITKQNYENYKDVSFTISMAE